MSRIRFNPERGVVADFDFNPIKGSETGKIRPCVVVTNNVYNSKLTVIQVVPITEWTNKKSKILTNVTLIPSPKNGLDKKSIADCLQTRPVDYTKRFVRERGRISDRNIKKIDEALKIVFGLESF